MHSPQSDSSRQKDAAERRRTVTQTVTLNLESPTWTSGGSVGQATTDGWERSGLQRSGEVAHRRGVHKRQTSAKRRNTEVLGKDQCTAEDRLELVALLERNGNGSVLRGWRSEIDPQGNLGVDQSTFCKSANRLAFDGDAQLLFGISPENLDNLKVEDVTPRRGNLIRRFQRWVNYKFVYDSMMSSHVRFFNALVGSPCRSLNKDMFVQTCKELGFEAEDEELVEIYNCCDFADIGAITQDDLVFLVMDPKLRQNEIFKSKQGEDWAWKKAMAEEYMERARTRSSSNARQEPPMSPSHRLAPRPWQANEFESLPTVVCQRRYERLRESMQKEQQAREAFLQHVQKIFGNEVRLLRHPDGLDPEGSFKFNLQTLRRYLRKHTQTEMDVHTLWKALDQDGDGYAGLEDLSITRARVLARFWTWAHQRYGSCAAVWDQPELQEIRKSTSKAGAWVSEKKMLAKSLMDGLKALGWSDEYDVDSGRLLCSSFDFYDCGLVMLADFEWLDKWQPPEYLASTADAPAWEDLKAHLIKCQGHLLRAWRCCFDLDDSNTVSWREFRDGCQKVKFKGNVAGIWVHLDADSSGMLSMKEYDLASYKMLCSFKEWADINFGSVRRCFDTLDEDSNGKISLREMKRVCTRLQWLGDVETLFECLDVDGRVRKTNAGNRTLELPELAFLDEWIGDLDHEQENTATCDGEGWGSQRRFSAGSGTPTARRNSRASRGSSAPGGKRLPVCQTAAPELLQRPWTSDGTSRMSPPLSPIFSVGCRCGLASGCSPLGTGHKHIVSDTLTELRQSRKRDSWTLSRTNSSKSGGASNASARSKFEAAMAKVELLESQSAAARVGQFCPREPAVKTEAPRGLRSPYLNGCGQGMWRQHGNLRRAVSTGFA